MLTAPANGVFSSQGNFIPVFGIALAVDGHEPEMELNLGVVSIAYTTRSSDIPILIAALYGRAMLSNDEIVQLYYSSIPSRLTTFSLVRLAICG